MGLPERREYSARLGVIEAAQLTAVADQFRIGTIVDAWTPSGGLFGQIVMLETTQGRYVFRGNPHGHAHLTKERCVARLIHERSPLPAPWPYQISDDATLFGWTYAVMPMLPGTCGRELWASADANGRVEPAASGGSARKEAVAQYWLRWCYVCSMSEIAARELRNHTAEVLRRVEGGERVTITSRGRPVAELAPVRSMRRRPIARTELASRLARKQADPGLRQDLAALAGDTTDDLDPIRS